jgi:hypothetical protein
MHTFHTLTGGAGDVYLKINSYFRLFCASFDLDLVQA